MKKKTLYLILSCVAVMFAALVVLTRRFPELFSSMMAFPFEQAADGLSLLAKAGRIGNGIASALWIGISAVPILIALRISQDKETQPERISLFVLSGMILLALYGMVNPHNFQPAGWDGFSETASMIKSLLGVSVWAVVVLYIILRLVRLFRSGNKEQLLRYMRTVLYALCFIFAAIAATSFAKGITALIDSCPTSADMVFGVFRLVC